MFPEIQMVQLIFMYVWLILTCILFWRMHVMYVRIINIPESFLTNMEIINQNMNRLVMSDELNDSIVRILHHIENRLRI